MQADPIGRETTMRPLKDESGQAILLWVLCLGVILGFCAFAVDASILFRASRTAQAAADSAATAAADEVQLGSSSTVIHAVGQAAASQNGVNNGVNNAVVTINNPPTSGYHTGSTYVEVLVSVPTKTFFMNLNTFLGSGRVAADPMKVTARAVAGYSVPAPSGCIYLLASSGTDLQMNNDAQFTATGCGIIVDSATNSNNSSTAVAVSGSANLTSPTLAIVGGDWVDNSGSAITATVTTGITSQPDPLSSMAAPTVSGCVSDPLSNYGNGGSTYTVGPSSSTGSVCYNSLTLGANGDHVTVNPGLYIINGNLTVDSATISGGSGVTFYITGGGSVNIAQGATISLSAPTTGTYAGVLFFQDRSDSSAAQFQGGANSTIKGTLYFPDATVNIANGTSTTGFQAPIVAQKLLMAGGATVTDSNYANNPIPGGGGGGTTNALVE